MAQQRQRTSHSSTLHALLGAVARCGLEAAYETDSNISSYSQAGLQGSHWRLPDGYQALYWCHCAKSQCSAAAARKMTCKVASECLKEAKGDHKSLASGFEPYCICFVG